MTISDENEADLAVFRTKQQSQRLSRGEFESGHLQF